jgi:hypothetical protein
MDGAMVNGLRKRTMGGVMLITFLHESVGVMLRENDCCASGK